MKKLTALLLIIASCVLITVACNKDNGSDQQKDDFDRKAMLTHLADNLIIPAYSNLQTIYSEMKSAADAFIAAPDVTKLTALRQKWQAAYIAWQQVELYNFGPADQVLLRNYFNIYPTDVTLLNSYVSSGSYDLEVLTNNKVQGFPALDYLVNGLGATDTEILNYYTAHADAAKRKKYLGDVINTMNTKLNTVVSDWKGAYRQQFINSDGTGAGSSVSLMLNEYIMYFERFLRSGKFAIPAGVMSGTAAPEKVEAFYNKQLGMTLAKTALKACRDFYQGKAFNGNTNGPSLQTYLQALGKNNANVTTLATNIESQFGVLENKMNALSTSVYDAIVNNRPKVLELYDEFQKQVRYLKVDMTSAIGITISYTDNDGD
jgi:predicted lipoprotein